MSVRPRLTSGLSSTSRSRASEIGLSSEAGEGTRTLDLRLGKPTLYQLSYARKAHRVTICGHSAFCSCPDHAPNPAEGSRLESMFARLKDWRQTFREWKRERVARDNGF